MINTQPIEKTLQDLSEVKNWLASLGIRTEGTRFDEIYRNVSNIVEYKKNRTIKEFIEDHGFETYLYALNDSLTFIDIYKAFSTIKYSMPVNKLRSAIGGPFIPNDEDAASENVNHRNTLFELQIASILLSKGLEIDKFDDVIFQFENIKFFIECKRLSSTKRVGENIEMAYKQLTKKMNNQNERGIIALSIEKIFDLHDKLYEASSIEQLHKQLSLVGDIFRTKYGLYWEKFMNIKIIGIFLAIRFPAILNNSKIINSRIIDCISLRSDLQKSDRDILYRLVSLLNS